MGRNMMLFLAMFITMTFGLIFSSMQQHEGVHVAIAKNYGNCTTEVVWCWNTATAYTLASNCTFKTMSDHESYQYLNSMNEIIGYNVFEVMMAIIFGSFLIAFAIFAKQSPKG
jgi:hypothetical protein